MARRFPNHAGRVPDAVFHLAAQTIVGIANRNPVSTFETPLVNVDLLIQDERQGTLLSWREDPHYGAGWHVPGGIIRFQETALDRVRAVARLELGAEVEPEAEPLMVHEAIDRRVRTRGHFYSLLFRCAVRSGPAPSLEAVADPPQRGQWRWHRTCPDNLLEVHRVYGKFFV